MVIVGQLMVTWWFTQWITLWTWQLVSCFFLKHPAGLATPWMLPRMNRPCCEEAVPWNNDLGGNQLLLALLNCRVRCISSHFHTGSGIVMFHKFLDSLRERSQWSSQSTWQSFGGSCGYPGLSFDDCTPRTGIDIFVIIGEEGMPIHGRFHLPSPVVWLFDVFPAWTHMWSIVTN